MYLFDVVGDSMHLGARNEAINIVNLVRYRGGGK
jgi:hypothetical protein